MTLHRFDGPQVFQASGDPIGPGGAAQSGPLRPSRPRLGIPVAQPPPVGGTYMKREVKILPTRERTFLFDFSRGAPVSMTASPAPRGRRDRRAVENGPLGSSSEIARRSPPAGRTGAERGSSELHRRDRRLFRIFRLTGQSKSVAQAPMRDSPKEVHEDRRA